MRKGALCSLATLGFSWCPFFAKLDKGGSKGEPRVGDLASADAVHGGLGGLMAGFGYEPGDCGMVYARLHKAGNGLLGGHVVCSVLLWGGLYTLAHFFTIPARMDNFI